MNKKRKIVLVLAIISLVIFAAGAAYTYAKYFTRSNSTLGSQIKKWEIKINDESISGKTTLTNDITITFDDNEHVAENKIAPGTEGLFEIEIDYTNVSLNFSYDLSIAESDTLPDVELSKIEVDGNEISITRDPQGVAHVIGNITVDGVTTSKTILVYIKWNDDAATESMDDAEDTAVGYDDSIPSATFSVQMEFVQLNT